MKKVFLFLILALSGTSYSKINLNNPIIRVKKTLKKQFNTYLDQYYEIKAEISDIAIIQNDIDLQIKLSNNLKKQINKLDNNLEKLSWITFFMKDIRLTEKIWKLQKYLKNLNYYLEEFKRLKKIEDSIPLNKTTIYEI